MAPVSSFDFVHAENVWRQRFDSVWGRRRLREPSCVLGAILLACAVTIAADVRDLSAALRVQRTLTADLMRSRGELGASRNLAARVRRLTLLDGRIRRIVRSGDERARQLAALANAMPPHTWLRSITPNDGSLAIDGEARDWARLGAMLRSFDADPLLRPPVLSDAVADERAPHAIRFAVRAGAGT